MRVKSLTLSMSLVLGLSALGCKTAPKFPWFGSTDKSVATTAAVAPAASQAPQLPSEIAKQAEALSSNPVKITTAPATTATAPAAISSAPAYTASNISPYPNTGAQGFLPTTTASAGSPSATPAVASSKSKLPYDPNAVPPASKEVASRQTSDYASAQTDRYGAGVQDRYSSTYPTTPAPTSTPSAPTNSSPVATSSEHTASVPASSSVPFASHPGSNTLGDRYATQNTPIASPTSPSASFNTESVQPASAVASMQPYRPGGTSSYPGTSANYEVATQPATPTAPAAYPGQGENLYR